MNADTTWFGRSVRLLGTGIGILLGLVGLALLVILSRPLFVVALIAMVPALIAYLVHRGFRRWLDAKIDDYVSLKGLRLPSGIALHRGHCWAQIFPRHIYVGADDLIQSALGPVQAVELPPVGTHVQQGDRLFLLRRGNRSVELRAPVSGTVLARNEALLERQGSLNTAPFTSGWAVQLSAENVVAERQGLLVGQAARTWFGREIDRLVASIRGEDELEATYADGGELVEDLYRHIDDDAWRRWTAGLSAQQC